MPVRLVATQEVEDLRKPPLTVPPVPRPATPAYEHALAEE